MPGVFICFCGMIVGILTVRYRDHRIANDVIKGVPQEVYRAMAVDLGLGGRSAIEAFEFPAAGGERFTIVKATILSVRFKPTGNAPDITMPRWVSIR